MFNLSKCLVNISAILALAALSSCNIRPVYSQNYHGAAYKILSSTEVIDHASSLSTVEFYSHLRSLLPKQVKYEQNNYKLDATIAIEDSYNLIQKNSDILRQNAKAMVNYRLTNNSGKIITSGSFSSFVSYNIASFPYSSLSISQGVYNNLSIAAAEKIINKIALYIETHQDEITIE